MTRRGKPAVVASIALLTVGLVALSVLRGPASWVVVAGSSMEPTLYAGDIALTLWQRSYGAGDVVAFAVPAGEPGAGQVVIHRIVRGSKAEGYVVKGDNRRSIDPWRPGPSDIVGRMLVGVPRLGLAVEFLRTPLGLSLIAALVAFAVALPDGRKAGRQAMERRTAGGKAAKRPA